MAPARPNNASRSRGGPTYWALRLLVERPGLLRNFPPVPGQGFGRYVCDPVYHYITDLALIDEPQDLFGQRVAKPL
jgi:hypothetical protein